MTDTRTLPARAERRWSGVSADSVLSTWATGIAQYAGDPGRPNPPNVIVFGAGNPDPDSFPWEGLLAAARRVMERDFAGALIYGPSQGEPALREWLANRLNAQEDAGVGPEHFFLTHGSGQAIQMVAQAYLNPGDTLLVERPSYPGAMRTFRAHGGEPVGVAMDDEGLVVASLEETAERLAQQGRAPRLLYTMPTFHNPTGITASLARREAIADACDRLGILIVEDDAYGEVRCDGERLPSYYKLTGGHGALRLSTFSKMLSTGLRVGWITGRKDFIDTFARLRFDGGLSPFLIRTVAEFCISGDQDRHLERVIPIYREKRDRLVSALSERCGRHITWVQPDGGYFLWIKLGDHLDPAKVAEAAGRERVAARPGTQFFPEKEGENYLRLCFSNLSVEEIEEGVQRLGRALDQGARD
jgi:2-aminoadipate transaminase